MRRAPSGALSLVAEAAWVRCPATVRPAAEGFAVARLMPEEAQVSGPTGEAVSAVPVFVQPSAASALAEPEFAERRSAEAAVPAAAAPVWAGRVALPQRPIEGRWLRP